MARPSLRRRIVPIRISQLKLDAIVVAMCQKGESDLSCMACLLIVDDD